MAGIGAVEVTVRAGGGTWLIAGVRTVAVVVVDLRQESGVC